MNSDFMRGVLVGVIVGVVMFMLVESVKAQPPKVPLTQTQISTLLMAKRIGETVEVNGESLPTAAQMLSWETCAGIYGRNSDGVIVGDKDKPVLQRAYGKWQVRLISYYETIKRYPHLKRFSTKEEIIAALMYNDEYCCEVAVHYFALLYERYGWSKAFDAYNAGRPKSEPTKYYKRMLTVKKDIIDKFNTGHYSIVRGG